MEDAHHLFDAYAVVGAVTPLEPTDETVELWQDRAADVVDVALISDSEETPEGYVALRWTPGGRSAGLCGDGRDMFMCVKRRGKERPGHPSTAPAVTELKVSHGGDSDEQPKRRPSSASFGINIFGPRSLPKEETEGWTTIGKTAGGGEARLKGGSRLVVRHAERADASQPPLLDVCVVASGEKAPRGYDEEAIVSQGGLVMGSATRIFVRRGSLCGACNVTWRSSVLDRYPAAEEGDDDGFAWDVLPMLAWPHGLRLEVAPVTSPPPVRYVPYALTGDSTHPTFVASLVFYEPLQPEQRRRARGLAGELYDDEVDNDQRVLYAPKCVSLLTQCAGVAEGARRWLAALYTLALSALETPLEHIVAHLVRRVPAPVRGGAPLSIRVNPSLPPIEIKLGREPPDAELPPLGASASIRSLFACLEPQDAVLAFTAALLERRILLVSKRAALVSDVAEALRALLFPLRWEGVYVPRLALPILETLDFPGAILAGVDAGEGPAGTAFAEAAVAKARDDDSGSYVLILLDEGRIENYNAVDSALFSRVPQLPDALHSQLAKRWAKVADAAGVAARDRDRAVAEEVFDNAPAPSALRFNKRRAHNKTFYDSSDDDMDECGPPEWTAGCERAARDAALTTLVQLLDGYSDNLIMPKVDYYSVSSSSLFNEDEFVKAPLCPSQTQAFRRKLVKTQSWARFVQRRIETSDPDLVLFDECTQALRDATDAHRNAVLRGDSLLLDSVDAAHHMKRLLAKSRSNESDVPALVDPESSPSDPARRSERLNWHMQSSRWRDERLLQTAAAREAGCTYGKDNRGRPRIEVPPPPPLVAPQITGDHATKKGATAQPKRYSYFVLGRGLQWPCPLDPALLPPPPHNAHDHRSGLHTSRSTRSNSAESISTRTLARSQAEILLDMGLSVAGLRLGGGVKTSQNASPSPHSSQWRDAMHLVGDDNPARATASRHLLHAFGAWFLFAPALVRISSTPSGAAEACTNAEDDAERARFRKGLCGAPAPMLLALGVLERVLEAPCEPDEAIFRALLVAAGRSGIACKPIVADLFAQLKGIGIRPNALTFGQYTRAIAQRDTYHPLAPTPDTAVNERMHNNNDDVDDAAQPLLIESLSADTLGGVDVAELVRMGLDRHRELRGLGDFVRIVVRLPKPMGIIFEERTMPLRGVFVKSVNDDGAAARDDTVRLGDVLVAVDETSCRESNFDTCIELIRLSRSPLTELTFERARTKPTPKPALHLPGADVASPSSHPELECVERGESVESGVEALDGAVTEAKAKDDEASSPRQATATPEAAVRGSESSSTAKAEEDVSNADDDVLEGDAATPDEEIAECSTEEGATCHTVSEGPEDPDVSAHSVYVGDTTPSDDKAPRMAEEDLPDEIEEAAAWLDASEAEAREQVVQRPQSSVDELPKDDEALPHEDSLQNEDEQEPTDWQDESESRDVTAAPPAPCVGESPNEDEALPDEEYTDEAAMWHGSSEGLDVAAALAPACVDDRTSTDEALPDEETAVADAEEAAIWHDDSEARAAVLAPAPAGADGAQTNGEALPVEEAAAQSEGTVWQDTSEARVEPAAPSPAPTVDVAPSDNEALPDAEAPRIAPDESAVRQDDSEAREEPAEPAPAEAVEEAPQCNEALPIEDVAKRHVRKDGAASVEDSEKLETPSDDVTKSNSSRENTNDRVESTAQNDVATTSDETERKTAAPAPAAPEGPKDQDKERLSSRVRFFVPSFAKAAAVLSGATKASRSNAAKALGSAGGALSSLVEDTDALMGSSQEIEPGAPGAYGYVSASLGELLAGRGALLPPKEHDSPPRVAFIWSGNASPHHPREPPLDEEIMASWPEELGQRMIRCSFTARAYEPQLAYSVLEVADAPSSASVEEEHVDDDLWVRLWRPHRRDAGAPGALSDVMGASRELVSAHPAELSASSNGIPIAPQSAECDEAVRLSTLLGAAGMERDVSKGTEKDGDDDGRSRGCEDADADDEMRRANCELSEGVGRCPYLSPLQLRYDLELQLQRHGENALEARTLAIEKPALFWGLWWYCARLQVPFPALPQSSERRTYLDDSSFATPRLAIAAWTRRSALAGAAAALRSMCEKRHAPVLAAASEARRPPRSVSRHLDTVRHALLGGASTRRRYNKRASTTERVRDACALFMEARGLVAAGEADASLTKALANDMYRALLRLNEPHLPGAIATTGPRKPQQSLAEGAASISPFDHAYREALATLHSDGVQGLQARDEPPAERVIIFRSIFGHLY